MSAIRAHRRNLIVGCLTLSLVLSPLPHINDGGIHLPEIDLSSPLRAVTSLISRGFAYVSNAAAGAVGAALGGGGPESVNAQVVPDEEPALPGEATVGGGRVEIVELRGAFTKHFREPDGTKTAEVHLGAIHFLNGQGTWEDIDTTLIPSDRPGYAFRNAKGPFRVDFAATARPADLVRFSSEGQVIRFAPSQPNLLSSAIVSGNRITYPEVYPGVDLVYVVANDFLKEQLVLKAPPAGPVTYRFPISLGSLEPREEVTGAISLLTADGDVQALIPPPWMQDTPHLGSGEPDVSSAVNLEMSTEGSQQVLEVTPDLTWLQDPSRLYPVVIDPTLDPNQVTNDDATVDSSTPNTSWASTDTLSTGVWPDSGDPKKRAYLKFDGVLEALAGREVLSASLRVRRRTSSVSCSASDCAVHLRRVVDPWSGLSLTWNNKPDVDSADTTDSAVTGPTGCSSDWRKWDATQVVNQWKAGQPNHGVRLSAYEANVTARKRWFSRDDADPCTWPYLRITYNTVPGIPTDLQPSDGTSSSQPEPELSAIYHDMDSGETGEVEYEVYDRSTPPQLIDNGPGTQVSDGQRSSFIALLDCDETYDWRARSADATHDSPWTAFQTYTTVTPGIPTLSSPGPDATVGSLTPTLEVQGQNAGGYRFVVTSDGQDMAFSPWLDEPQWTVPAGVLTDGGEYSWRAEAGGESHCLSGESIPRAFRVDALHLGNKPHYAMEAFSLGHGVQASVNIANGNLVVSETDVSVPTVEDPFVVSRTYNSRGAGKHVYVEDTIPYDGLEIDEMEWTWDSSKVWSGEVSHKEPAASGVHGHGFDDAQAQLFVPHGASLVTYVYLDGAQAPQEVMLQFSEAGDAGWDHRAYWGANLIPYGIDGTASRKRVGDLPATGGWARLEVKASDVGLDGALIDGVAYTLYDGAAWFDKTYLGSGPMGYGWSVSNELVLSELSFTRLVERPDNGHIELLSSDGATHFYYPTGTADQYRSDTGDFATVTKDVLGNWELKNAEGFRYQFSGATGDLTGIWIPERNDVKGFSYQYTAGRMTAILDALGRSLFFEYDGEGRLWKVKAGFDGDRVLATYGYDVHDQLISVTDASGHEIRYTYDPQSHDLLTITTPRGSSTPTANDFQTTFEYQDALQGEEFRRIQGVREHHMESGQAADLLTSFSYASAEPETVVTDPKGTLTPSDPTDFITTYEFNEQLNPGRTTDAAGMTTEEEWNPQNLRTRLEDREGAVWTYEYDGNGNLCRETAPVTDTSGLPAVTRYFYDEFTGSAYTCAAATKPTHNLLTRVIDPEGRVTATTYVDPAGGKPWVASETAGYVTAEAASTSFTYHQNVAEPWRYGKLATKTMPKGNDPDCDATCKVTYTSVYDYWGPSDIYSLPGDLTLVNIPQKGWLRSVTRAGDTPVVCGLVPASECHHYDFRGNEIHSLDAKGDHYLAYDLDDEVVRSQDRGSIGPPVAGGWTETTYDADGNRTAVADPEIAGDATAFTYDDLNRLMTSTDAWGTTTTYGYDANGNVTSKATAGVGTTASTYDGLDRPAALTDPQGKVTTYAAYDAEGRLEEKRLPNGTHVDYRYNEAGWLMKLHNRKGGTHGASEFTLADSEYTYDGSGKRLTEILPGYSPKSQSGSGSVAASGGSSDFAFNATAQGPVSATLNWSPTIRAFSFGSQSIGATIPPAPPTTTNHALQVSAAGTVNAKLKWDSILANLDLRLISPSGATVCESTAVVGKSEENLACPVSVSGTYQLRVVNQSAVAVTYDLTGDHPVYADLNLQLFNAGGTKVDETTSTTARPESLTYQVPATGTGAFVLKVLAATDDASFTLSYTYPEQRSRTYAYDAVGRLKTVQEGSTTRAYAFDRNSNRTGLSISGGSSETYSYNTLDQLTSLVVGGQTQSFTYSSAGELTKHLFPGYVTRSDSKTGSVSSTGTATQSTSLDATAPGPITASLNWASTTRDFSFNQSIPGVVPPATSVSQNHYVEVSATGDIEAWLGWDSPLVNLDLKLYDNTGGLVAESANLAGTEETIFEPAGGFGPGQQYRLEVVNKSALSTTYWLGGYTPVYGNLDLRLKKPGGTVVASATSATARPESVSYTVPAGGTGTYTLEATAVTDQASYTLSHSYPVENARTYAYDAGGLPVSEDTNLSATTWTVDGLDRVIRAETETWKGATTSDLRWGYEDSTDARAYEAYHSTGQVAASFVSDAGGLLATRRNGATTYPYFTGHGDVVRTANASGTEIEPFPTAFDEFGRTTSAQTPYGWHGRQERPTSALTGVIRMGVRLYDPALGRFLSRDPVEGGSLNDYEYAGGDPVNNEDLDGEIQRQIGGGGGFGGGGGGRGGWGAPKWRIGRVTSIRNYARGGSGKPRIHTRNYPSRKKALDASKGRGTHGSKAIEHRGRSHVHDSKKGRKVPGLHRTYPKRYSRGGQR